MRRILKKLGSNGGFSLVELLVAILILAIVISPLLHVMVTSANTTAKSRRIGNAVTTAQNLLETVKGADMNTLLANPAAYFDSPSITVTTEDGNTILTMPGVKETTTAFDTVVTISGDDIYDGSDVTCFTPMDFALAQPYDSNVNPDYIVAAAFAYEMAKYGVSATASDFLVSNDYASMDRLIEIKAEKDPTTSIINITATYSYMAKYSYLAPPRDVDGEILLDDDGNPMADVIHTVILDSNNLDGHNVSPVIDFTKASGDMTSAKAAYFFYYPSYNISAQFPRGTNYHDEIDIINMDNLEMTFFIIKMNPTSPDPAIENIYGVVNELWLGNCESNYRARINLHEDHASEETMRATVLTNMGDNLVSGGTPPTIVYRQFRSVSNWYTTSIFTGQLVNKEPDMRFYNVSVSVFPAGGGDVLYKLEGNRLG